MYVKSVAANAFFELIYLRVAGTIWFRGHMASIAACNRLFKMAQIPQKIALRGDPLVQTGNGLVKLSH